MSNFCDGFCDRLPKYIYVGVQAFETARRDINTSIIFKAFIATVHCQPIKRKKLTTCSMCVNSTITSIFRESRLLSYGLQASSNRRLNCCIFVNVQTQANVFYRGVFAVMVENYVIMSFIASLKSIT